jgi:hypothetical protein
MSVASNVAKRPKRDIGPAGRPTRGAHRSPPSPRLTLVGCKSPQQVSAALAIVHVPEAWSADGSSEQSTLLGLDALSPCLPAVVARTVRLRARGPIIPGIRARRVGH